MTVYLVFSDEAGQYRRERNANFLKRYPFYCRSSLMLSVEDWLSLRGSFEGLKSKWGIPKDFELKWDTLWLRKSMVVEKFNAKFPEISHLFLKDMLGFVQDCFVGLGGLDSCKLVFTVTDNSSAIYYKEITLWKKHVEDIMQRVQMTAQSGKNDLAVVFLDNIHEDAEKEIREECFDLIRTDKLVHYSHIKDSVYFEYSHHSFAMQLADFCAGVFNGTLRGFDDSKILFRMVYPGLIRKSNRGAIMGYGVCEIPTDKEGTRLRIRNLISIALSDDS